MGIELEELQAILSRHAEAAEQRSDKDWWKGYSAAIHAIRQELREIAAPAPHNVQQGEKK